MSDVPAAPTVAPPQPRLSSGQTTTIAVVAGCGGLLLLCCGVSGVVAGVSVAGARSQIAGMAERKAAIEAKANETRERLEQVADGLRRLDELPEALAETPPRDAWGRPVRYRRFDPGSARLTSAGPDGDLATGADNVDVEVRLR